MKDYINFKQLNINFKTIKNKTNINYLYFISVVSGFRNGAFLDSSLPTSQRKLVGHFLLFSSIASFVFLCLFFFTPFFEDLLGYNSFTYRTICSLIGIPILSLITSFFLLCAYYGEIIILTTTCLSRIKSFNTTSVTILLVDPDPLTLIRAFAEKNIKLLQLLIDDARK